jgi:hypothetical protein
MTTDIGTHQVPSASGAPSIFLLAKEPRQLGWIMICAHLGNYATYSCRFFIDVAGQPIGPDFRGQERKKKFLFLTPEDGTDWLSRNVCKITTILCVISQFSPDLIHLTRGKNWLAGRMYENCVLFYSIWIYIHI